MELTFGKYDGNLIEEILIFDPQYIVWMISQEHARGGMLQALVEIPRYIARFNAKPYLMNCHGWNCDQKASHCTVKFDQIHELEWWCDLCNPHRIGVDVGMRQKILTYEDALNHVELWCDCRPKDFETLVLELALAKGLPASNLTEDQLIHFFGYP